MQGKQPILQQQYPLHCAFTLDPSLPDSSPTKGADLTASWESQKKRVIGFDILVVIKEDYSFCSV